MWVGQKGGETPINPQTHAIQLRNQPQRDSFQKINKQTQLILHRADCAVFDKSSCSSSLQLQPIFTAVSDIMIALLYFTARDLYRIV